MILELNREGWLVGLEQFFLPEEETTERRWMASLLNKAIGQIRGFGRGDTPEAALLAAKLSRKQYEDRNSRKPPPRIGIRTGKITLDEL